MLHILNGDGMAKPFKQAPIPANDYLIWREILFEGPIIVRGSPVDFWQARQHYISQTYQEAPTAYVLQVTAEVKRLETFSLHDEVVLWFEHDLLCQINLLYLLHWFAQQALNKTTLSLVCIGSHPEMPDFKGLGNLSPEQLAALFRQRQVLTSGDLALGDRGWQAFASPTPENLINFLQEEDFTRLPLLPDALRAHLTRFPSVQNGLNAIEQLLLEIIAQHSPTTTQLFHLFWQRTTLFGLGDTQIINYLKELEQADLIKRKDQISITDLGNKALRYECDYVQLRPLN
ncbi:MAG: RNA polymerase subunit sigma, partial [Bacteroidota bacterium]|nr:RNA polymerase subunit sigma [Bacteroidota bacterium]